MWALGQKRPVGRGEGVGKLLRDLRRQAHLLHHRWQHKACGPNPASTLFYPAGTLFLPGGSAELSLNY